MGERKENYYSLPLHHEAFDPVSVAGIYIVWYGMRILTISEKRARSLLVKLLRFGGTSGGILRFKLVSLDGGPEPIELPLAIPRGGSCGGPLVCLFMPPAFIELPGIGAGGC